MWDICWQIIAVESTKNREEEGEYLGWKPKLQSSHIRTNPICHWGWWHKCQLSWGRCCRVHAWRRTFFNSKKIKTDSTQMISYDKQNCELHIWWHVWKSKAWSVPSWFPCRLHQIISCWNWKTDCNCFVEV